ncbi:MAG: hypothetical protein ACOZCL_07005 [Bacillota bacterium]
MKRARILILIGLISAAGLLSWFYISKRPVENMPKRATMVMNIIDEKMVREQNEASGVF